MDRFAFRKHQGRARTARRLCVRTLTEFGPRDGRRLDCTRGHADGHQGIPAGRRIRQLRGRCRTAGRLHRECQQARHAHRKAAGGSSAQSKQPHAEPDRARPCLFRALQDDSRRPRRNRARARLSQRAPREARCGLLRRVGLPDRRFAEFLADYRRRFPEIVLDLSFEDRFVDIVAEGYDLALRITGRGRSLVRSWAHCPPRALSPLPDCSLAQLSRPAWYAAFTRGTCESRLGWASATSTP